MSNSTKSKFSPKKITFLVIQALILVSMIAGSLQSNAWIAKDQKKNLYTFKFNLAGSSYEYTQESSSFEEAFDKAAQACYRHYKNGKKLSENQGLDIIDVCANPRS